MQKCYINSYTLRKSIEVLFIHLDIDVITSTTENEFNVSVQLYSVVMAHGSYTKLGAINIEKKIELLK